MSVTKVTDAMRNVTQVDAAKITTGTIPDARIQASGVTQHVTATDLTSIHQAIATLALHTAVADNKAAFNLPNAFIDTFEDDTGIATETTTDRNASEYVSSAVATTSAKHTVTISGDVARSSTQSKFGGYSASFDGGTSSGNDYINIPYHADFDQAHPATMTFEFWMYQTAWPTNYCHMISRGSAVQNWSIYQNAANRRLIVGWLGVNAVDATNNDLVLDQWQHCAIVINAGTTTFYIDGNVSAITGGSATDNWIHQNNTGGDTPVRIGGGGLFDGSYSDVTGYIDEVRISNVARYTSSFTPSTTAFVPDANTKLLLHMNDTGLLDESISSTSTNATGTLVSTVQTAPVATTTLSGVILYTDEAGTNTLGSSDELAIYLTANLQGTTPNWTGTNWTEATSYGTPQTFSGTTKQVKLGKTTVTSGTAIAMKAVWANQVATVPAVAGGYATGDQSSSITVTTDLGMANSTIDKLVEGATADNTYGASTGCIPTVGGATVGKYIRFDYGSGNSKIITASRFYQAGTKTTHGVWKWQGSNDASSWTDIGSNFTLGSTSFITAMGDMSSNTTAYRYYQLYGISGTTASAWWSEMEFSEAAVAEITGKVAQLNGWAVNY